MLGLEKTSVFYVQNDRFQYQIYKCKRKRKYNDNEACKWTYVPKSQKSSGDAQSDSDHELAVSGSPQMISVQYYGDQRQQKQICQKREKETASPYPIVDRIKDDRDCRTDQNVFVSDQTMFAVSDAGD